MVVVTTGGIFPPEDFPPLQEKPIQCQPKPPDLSHMLYANLLKPKVQMTTVIMLNGEPTITWKSSEVKSLVTQENLQYAVIGKFSYGKLDIMELRRTIPGQCGIKSECNIGVLDTRHVLIRLTNLEDYVHLMSIATFQIHAKNKYWQMRTLKWDPWFEPDVETPIGVAWISFPDLPPNFFAKEAIFSVASAVGKPLTVDTATKNQTRPSCAKVKIEVDLTTKLPQRVRITEEDDITSDTKHKWIKVHYDYMPKYCKECSLQGHDERNCWTIHPELYKSKMIGEKSSKGTEEPKEMTNKEGDMNRAGSSKQIIKQDEWIARSRNKYKRDKYGHIKGKNDINDDNPFEALNEKDELEQHDGEIEETSKEGKKNQYIEGNKQEETKEDQDAKTNQVYGKEEEEWKKEGVIVIFESKESKKEEVLPLAVQDKDQKDPQEQLDEVSSKSKTWAEQVEDDEYQNNGSEKENFQESNSPISGSNLNHNAPIFVPKSGGNIKNLMDTPIGSNLSYQEESVIARKSESGALASGFSPTNVYAIDLGDDCLDVDEEDNMLDICFDQVARDGDISPRQQRSGSNRMKKKSHGRQHSWDGKVIKEFVPRHLPMRLAKQNHLTVSIASERSNQSKKK